MILPYKEKFEYPTVISESTSDSGRVYYMGSNGIEYDGLYSVTTILSKTSNTKEIIQQWKDRIGHKNANGIVTNSINKGQWMHDILYYRIIGEDYHSKFPNNYLFQLTSKMADKIQEYIDRHLSEVWGAEVPVFVPKHYAGRIDCVGVYRNKQSIVDFKNSYNEKKEEHMYSYKLQCAAYAVAHDYLFNTNIEQAVILICNSDDISAREIITNGQEFQNFKNEWINIMDSFING